MFESLWKTSLRILKYPQKVLTFSHQSIKSRRKLILVITLSLLIHTLFLSGLFFNSVYNSKSIQQNEPQTITVEMIEDSSPKSKYAPKVAKKNPKIKTNTKLNILGKSSAEIYEAKLNNTNGDQPYFTDNEFRPTKDNYDSYGEAGAYNYLDKGGIAKIFENNNFYSQLWRKIRGLTGFPQDFLNYRMKGQVRIHALVNEKGQMIGDFLKVSSANPILEIYSMAILAISLKKPLPKKYWSQDKQIPIVFEFNFNHVHDELSLEQVKNHHGHYNGNLFNFTTTRYIPTEFEQAINDFFSDYVPPVLILPGGMIYIDLIALYDKYQRWKNNTLFAKTSTLRKQGAKNFKQEILLALQFADENVLRKLNTQRSYFNSRVGSGGPTNSLLNKRRSDESTRLNSNQ